MKSRPVILKTRTAILKTTLAHLEDQAGHLEDRESFYFFIANFTITDKDSLNLLISGDYLDVQPYEKERDINDTVFYIDVKSNK